MNKRIEIKTSGGLPERIDFLREVTTALLSEIKALVPLKTLNIQDGIDLDQEVMQFEIHLIESALKQTGGSQSQAARLLNIKNTTLNAKIKRFQISLARTNVRSSNSNA